TKPIRYSLDTHQEADVLSLKKIQYGAHPSGTSETDQAISKSQQQEILNEWRARHGGAKNAGKTTMLPTGLHVNKTEESNADMQYVEGMQANMKEIRLFRFWVPSSVVLRSGGFSRLGGHG